jgi:hypothetical protein
MFFEYPTQESHSKFSVTNHKDEDLREDPSNAGSRLQQASRPKKFKADDDDDGGSLLI